MSLLDFFFVFSRPNPSLKLFQEVFNGVQVRILRWPLKDSDIVVAQPLIDEARRVFGIVVMLKDLSSQWGVAACATGEGSGTSARSSCPGYG